MIRKPRQIWFKKERERGRFIASAFNPDNLELVEVEIENIDGKKENIKALQDTGANITMFELEILPKLCQVDNLVEETKISVSQRVRPQNSRVTIGPD
jgi:hypothetical protein